MLRKHIQRLEDLPNIGKSIAHDLRGIGIVRPDDLLHVEPLAVFNQLAEVMGQRHDPCVLYTLIAAQHYLHGAEPQPWWKYTAEGKKLLRTSRL
jgi:DNA transformation protein